MQIPTTNDAGIDPAAPGPSTGLARAGLWLLPVYGVLLALGTLSHQADYKTDFPGYARYVVTDHFLLSHLVASILGGAIGVLGLVAALAFLVRGPAVRRAIAGMALFVVGNTVITSVFGAAAFAQPAIGRAWDRGVHEIVAVNDDVYGTPLIVTVSLGLLALMTGAVLLGVAMRRTHPRLRGAGLAFAGGMVVFVLAGFTVEILQPVAALVVTVAAVVIARRLPSAVGPG